MLQKYLFRGYRDERRVYRSALKVPKLPKRVNGVCCPFPGKRAAYPIVLPILEALREETHQLLLKEYMAADKARTEDEYRAIEKAVLKQKQNFAKRFCYLQANNFEIYGALLGIGIRHLSKRPFQYNFMNFSNSLRTQKRFDKLPQGAYSLTFSVDNSAHDIVFLKIRVGSYLFDPNKGLMKVNGSKPSKELSKLLEKYQKDCKDFIGIYPFKLNPAS